jgi:hypothetical protein
MKLKPSADTDEPAQPARGKRPVKEESRQARPRSTSRKKVKPTDREAPPTRRRSGRRRSQEELDDQVPRRGGRRRGISGGSRGYVRFRVRVDEGGQASIVDSHFVDDDLTMAPTIHGEHAYEVSLGDRLLHADTIPDLGVVRSFSDPHGTPEQRRHHTYREGRYDFDVRVPAAELTRRALPKIEIALYRAKDRAPTRRLTEAAPLGSQFERELREVTRLAGIPRESLPRALRR